MFTCHKWISGAPYSEVAASALGVVGALGWVSEWSSGGKPALQLRVHSCAALGANPPWNPIAGYLIDRAVTAAELSAYNDLAQNPDHIWSLRLSCFPADFSPQESPLYINGVISGGAVQPEGYHHLVNSSGLIKFMYCGVNLAFYYARITKHNLELYTKAYEVTKELWRALGSDTCYGRHEKSDDPTWNTEGTLLFQFSLTEPVRLILPLEECRLPTPDEVRAEHKHPGLWHQAAGRLDLEPGEWDWRPSGLASVGLPRSKEDWERRQLPLRA